MKMGEDERNFFSEFHSLNGESRALLASITRSLEFECKVEDSTLLGSERKKERERCVTIMCSDNKA